MEVSHVGLRNVQASVLRYLPTLLSLLNLNQVHNMLLGNIDPFHFLLDACVGN